MNNKTLTLLAVALGGYYLYTKQPSKNTQQVDPAIFAQLEGYGYVSTGSSCCTSCSSGGPCSG